MLKSNFNSFNKVKNGKAFYKFQTVGLAEEINIVSLIRNLKSTVNENSDVYYAGQPYTFDRERSKIKDVDFTAGNIQIDGIVGYSMIKQGDVCDKTNEEIGYITYKAGELVPTWKPKGQIVYYVANEVLKMHDKVKFVLDANGVARVAVAGNDDFVIGEVLDFNDCKRGDVVKIRVSF